MIIHKKNSYFDLLSFLNYSHFSNFCFMVLICTTGKEICSYFKYNRLKLSTSTLKEPVVSSSAAHTSSASNLTRTSISSQLDNKDIIANQNKNNISNIDDIHSCIHNIILYCKYVIKKITKNNLSWCKMKYYVDFQLEGGGGAVVGNGVVVGWGGGGWDIKKI